MFKFIGFLLISLILLPNAVFAQIIPGNTDSEYRIAVSDLLEISVYEEPDLTKVVRVAADGTISYPLLGNIFIKGLTAKELETKITEMLAKDYLVNPQVSIFIKEHSKISVLGAVEKPGAYELKTGLSIIDAIAMAGGFTEKADKTKVRRIREKEGKKETIEINVNTIAKDVYAGKEIMLEPGDVIIVEELGTISIVGQVDKPGRYDLKDGMTVIDAIAIAGGLTDIAAGDGTKVIRSEKGKKQIFRVPITSIIKSGDKSQDVLLRPDDTIVVPESFF